MHANFEEILQNCLEVASKPVDDSADGSANRLEVLSKSLCSFTHPCSFRELSTLTYGVNSTSVVVSMQFDKDGDFFAVADR